MLCPALLIDCLIAELLIDWNFICLFRWEDYLQTPLQPLTDNLDTHTYNVFEKDPIKYDQYQKAIARALTLFKTNAKVTNQLMKYYYFMPTKIINCNKYISLFSAYNTSYANLGAR